jgi:hypothetical protein
MIRIPAGNLFASASSIGGACKFFQVGRRQLREQGDSLSIGVDTGSTGHAHRIELSV